MARIIRHKEVLGAFAVLVVFGLLFLWGQSSAAKTSPAAADAAALSAARVDAATMSAAPPAMTYRAGTPPKYTESVWDFLSYQTYTMGVYLSNVETSKLTTTQITTITRDFGAWLKRAFPNANRDYRALCLVKYPNSVKALQMPKGTAESIMKAGYFSEAIITFGRNFSNSANYQKTINGFYQDYLKRPEKNRPVPQAQFVGILEGYGKWISALDDCVTINTAGARGAGGNQIAAAQSCGVCVGPIIISANNMSCGVCVITLSGAGAASCAQQTCGGGITCGNNASTCGATCGQAATCLGVTCGGGTCLGVSCSSNTCGVALTCGSGVATCGAATCAGASSCALVCDVKR
jgi:hypothetical protein